MGLEIFVSVEKRVISIHKYCLYANCNICLGSEIRFVFVKKSILRLHSKSSLIAEK